jgi:hypothetical protein
MNHPHGTGFILDAPGTWLRFAHTHPAATKFKAATAKRPSSGGPDSFAPPIYDQDGVGACVGEWYACQLFTFLASIGHSPISPFSGRGAYAISRMVDRAATYPTRKAADLPALVDEGASPSQCWRAALKYGLGNIDELDDRKLVIDAALACTPLNGTELIACDARRPPVPIEMTEIPADDPTKVDQLLDALAAGMPAGISLDGGCAEFQGYAGGILDWVGGPMDLDHMVTVTFFTTDAAGAPTFKIRNSWNEGWGEGGCLRVTERYIRAAGGIIVPRIVT